MSEQSELKQEIRFLAQALQARKVQTEMDLALLAGEQTPLVSVAISHNHWCRWCNAAWTCRCMDGTHEVQRHGCSQQKAASKRLAIALRQPSPWDAPYLSRYAKKPKPTRKGVGLKQARAELARLKALVK